MTKVKSRGEFVSSESILISFTVSLSWELRVASFELQGTVSSCFPGNTYGLSPPSPSLFFFVRAGKKLEANAKDGFSK